MHRKGYVDLLTEYEKLKNQYTYKARKGVGAGDAGAESILSKIIKESTLQLISTGYLWIFYWTPCHLCQRENEYF